MPKIRLKKLNPFYHLKRRRLAKRYEELNKKTREVNRKIDFLNQANTQMMQGEPVPPGVLEMTGKKAERHSPKMWRKLIKAELDSLEKISKKMYEELSDIRDETRKMNR